MEAARGDAGVSGQGRPPTAALRALTRTRSVRLLVYGPHMISGLIAIEARDMTGETCSRRTYELAPGLSEEDEHAEVERLVAHAHPEAVPCSTGRRGTYVEPGTTITVRPVVPPQGPTKREQHRLFAA